MSPADVRVQLQPELGPREKLLWAGRPRQGILLRPADALLIPFSLLWAGFAIFWESTVVRTPAPGFFVVWGIPFVAIGCYLVLGRFFVDARQRARTYYGVTNERILIVSGILGRKISSIDLRSLPAMSLDERRSGEGSIMFGSDTPGYWWMHGTGWPGANRRLVPRFDSIADARHVFELIRKAQHGAS
jgi:hypothetical protein